MAEEKKIIVFSLGHEEYGVEVEKVKTIERMQKLTRVPKTPVFIKGVINLRGVVIPVIDLRSRFSLPEKEYTDNTRMIIVTQGDIEVGLIVDSANDVTDIDADAVENPPEIVGGIRAKYLDGIAKIGDRLLVLLNLEQVLNKQELVQLEEFAQEV